MQERPEASSSSDSRVAEVQLDFFRLLQQDLVAVKWLGAVFLCVFEPFWWFFDGFRWIFKGNRMGFTMFDLVLLVEFKRSKRLYVQSNVSGIEAMIGEWQARLSLGLLRASNAFKIGYRRAIRAI